MINQIPSSSPEAAAKPQQDWAFLVGEWNVRHRRLKERLCGCVEWDEFAGTCVNWTTLGGFGNVDDNFLDLPGDPYRAVATRSFDASTGLWSIWWLDARVPEVGPPVRGGFQHGVGEFIGDDRFNGQPIEMRFRWSAMTARSAVWDQAFSVDGGKTWETNWVMDFTRAASP